MNTLAHARLPHLVEPEQVETFHVLGPIIQYLTSPDGSDDSPCIMRGSIPPGVVIPLHSHEDMEAFIGISGEAEGLASTADGGAWVPIGPGDVFSVPSNARHAFRNQGTAPAEMFAISTCKMGRFFQEIGTPLSPGGEPPGPPSSETLQRFQECAARYGYWNASPEENAQVGIPLPPA